MKLTKIAINNYKKLNVEIDSKTTKRYIDDDLKSKHFVELGPDKYYSTFFSIVGANGSGKSSIIEVFDFLKTFSILKYDSPKNFRVKLAQNSSSFGDFISIAKISQFEAFDMANKDKKIKSLKAAGEGEWNAHKVKVITDSIKNFYSKSLDSTKPITIELTLLSAEEEQNYTLQFFDGEYRIFLNNKVIDNVPNTLIDFVSKIVIFSQHSTSRPSIDPDALLEREERLIAGDFSKIQKVLSKKALIDFLKLCDKNIDDIAQIKSGNYVIYLHGRKTPINVCSLSQGTKVMIQYLSSILIADNKDAFFVADEIENHLNARLTNMIKTLVKEKNAQLLFTTHSPDVATSDILAKQIFALSDEFDEETEGIVTVARKVSSFISPNNDVETQMKKGHLTSLPSINSIFHFVYNLINEEKE